MTTTDGTATDFSDFSEVKKPAKEVPVVQDQGFFQHVTGDTYDGYFEVKKKDRSCKMQGPGVYTTAEGDVYSGIWEADRLGANEEVNITYLDSSKYEGLLKDWMYTGPAKYTYPDESILHCDFVENCPVGKLVLVDPNRHTWIGKAHLGVGYVEPVNHYYELLEKTRDTTKSKRRRRRELEDATGTSTM